MRGFPILLITLPGALGAQAPTITPAGDPSVNSDTIYALAVDPADHAGEDHILLLDDGVVRVEPDGRMTRTYRYVVQIFTREAAENWGELGFAYRKGNERLRINWTRVVGLDGKVISAQPVHEQEGPSPVAQTAPVYSDGRVRRLSLGGVAPNTIVDYSYTTELLRPALDGDFYLGWSVTTGVLVRRSRYIVDLPASMRPVIREYNVDFPVRRTERGKRRVHTWATQEVPEIEWQMFAGTPNDVVVRLAIVGEGTWADIGRWYAELARDRYVLTPELDRELAEVVAGRTTLWDSLQAAHRWVAQDFRYVSLSLGLGGYQPRPPAAVHETKYGDCKDKATLFIAIAERLGLVARPVLVSSAGGVEVDLPSIDQFDHMIAAIELPDGRRVYADLTSDVTPFGSLPPALQDEFGLVVHGDGSVEEVTLPTEPLEHDWHRVLVTGTISDSGVFAGTYTESASGTNQYALRSTFTSTYTEADGEEFARALAHNLFQGSRGDSLVAFDGRDLTVTPRVSIRIQDARITRSGDTWILNLPIATYQLQGLAANLEAEGDRRFPIDAEMVADPSLERSEFRVTLPEGWRARLPDDHVAESVFGRYEATYEQTGRELRIVRGLSGASGLQPPERIGELIQWLEDISQDNAQFVLLERAP